MRSTPAFLILVVALTSALASCTRSTQQYANRGLASKSPQGALLRVSAPAGANPLDVLRAIQSAGGSVLTALPEGGYAANAQDPESFAQNLPEGYSSASLDPVQPEPLADEREPDRYFGAEAPNDTLPESFQPAPKVTLSALGKLRAKLGARAAEAESENPPSMADNSLSGYFPPIGDQGSEGSCVSWASGYYYATFAKAKDNNWDDAWTGNSDHVCQPAFVWNMANGGQDTGIWTDQAMDQLTRTGCASFRTMGKYNGKTDYNIWPNEGAWVDALKMRMAVPHYFCAGRKCSDTDLYEIKKFLANGNLLVTDFRVYNSWYNNYGRGTNPSPSGPGYDNWVVYGMSSPNGSGHAVTLVGYDDDRVYKVNGQERRGAFLIANSWTSSWGGPNTAGRRGYFWISYDLFRNAGDGSSFGIAYYNDDRPKYRPKMYATVAVNHSQRFAVNFKGGVGIPSAPDFVDQSSSLLYNPGNRWTWKNGYAITADQPLVVDLTDQMGQITDPSDMNLYVNWSVWSAGFPNGSAWKRVDYSIDLDDSYAYSKFSDFNGGTKGWNAKTSEWTFGNHFSAAACPNIFDKGESLACDAGNTVIASRTIEHDPGESGPWAATQCRAFCRQFGNTGCCQLRLDPASDVLTCSATDGNPVPKLEEGCGKNCYSGSCRP